MMLRVTGEAWKFYFQGNSVLIMDCYDLPQLLDGRDIPTAVTPAALLSRGPAFLEELLVIPAY
jgi:hypothetical protein